MGDKGNVRSPQLRWIPSAWATRPHVFRRSVTGLVAVAGQGEPLTALGGRRPLNAGSAGTPAGEVVVTALIIYLSHLGKMPSTVPSCHQSTETIASEKKPVWSGKGTKKEMLWFCQLAVF